MSLIVEDGSGKSDAESFASVDFADAYFLARGNTAWAALTTDAKESALRQATDYMEQTYGERWKGSRMFMVQALDWPRYGVIVDNFPAGFESVPADVQKACASLASRAATASLAPDIKRETESVSIAGAVSVKYRQGSAPYTLYREVDGLLLRYLIAGRNGVQVIRG